MSEETIGADLIPRIPFEEFEGELKESLRPKVERLGYCGEIWQIGANAPKSMYQFAELTEALKEEIDMKYVELVALTSAGVMGNTYERNQHERLADNLGYGREWIKEVNTLEARAGGAMTEAEAAVQKFAIAAILRRGHMRCSATPLASSPRWTRCSKTAARRHERAYPETGIRRAYAGAAGRVPGAGRAPRLSRRILQGDEPRA
jgi:hypothetical protein